jgi:hypothetical protein
VVIPPGGPSASLPIPGGELPRFDDASLAVSVRHQGELVGALVASRMSPTEAHLTV